MLIKTENSIYEHDPVNKQIRRLSGESLPTAAFQQDGWWREYKNITDLKVGSRPFITWPGFLQFTILSEVQKIEQEDAEYECQSKISPERKSLQAV